MSEIDPFSLAFQNHQAGRLGEAERGYREILAREPRHVEALHHLGLIAYQVGQFDVALELIGRAKELSPDNPNVQCNFGNALGKKGRWPEAIAAFQQAIQIQPNFPEAYNNLGAALRELGRLAEAIIAFNQAIGLRENYPQAYDNLGSALWTQGRKADAITAFEKAIALQPDFAEAHRNLGHALWRAGRIDDAILACERAIGLQPADAQAHFTLGNCLLENRRCAEALAAYERAVGLNPTYAQAIGNMGAGLMQLGRHEEAAAAYRRAVGLRPECAADHINLCLALRACGRIEESIEAGRKAVALAPGHSEAHDNLGIALLDSGQVVQALAELRRAVELCPESANAQNNLGNALLQAGQIKEAIGAYQRAVAIEPDRASEYNNLGNALLDAGHKEEAIEAYQRAITIDPNLASAYNNLGNALKDQARLDEALAAYRSAMQLDPSFATAQDNLLYTLWFHLDYDASAIAEAHRQWDEQFARLHAGRRLPHSNASDPEKRLRVGYVAADLRDHALARYILPVLREHDRNGFEVVCYSNCGRTDAMTDRLRALADAWRNIFGVTDEQAAEMIRDDGIDVLIDLELHMAGTRLRIFARQPAPVQIAFAGYPGTTGLREMGYRLTDPYLDPPGSDTSIYTEESLWMPNTFWCYDAEAMETEKASEPGSLPALSHGWITFACLNNYCKVNDQTLRLWAKVLSAVPGSRLLVLSPEGSHRDRALRILSEGGVSAERVTFISNQPRAEYLRLYCGVDIGLDTLPYNGHTTSMDAFWMGVPVVTLAGQTSVGRGGVSQLSNLGMTELVARSEEDYVAIASDLAGDLPRLATLRAGLRERMRGSALMDVKGFARGVEQAYRAAWRRWCGR